MGKQAGEAELGGSTAFLTGVLNQLFKQFGHLSKAYAFGHDVIDFPSWMQTSHPGKWRALKRFIGNRADILCENSFLAHYMIPFYVEYLDWLVLELKTTCALHVRLRTKLLTEEFEAEMRAAGILWYHLIQPLRVMIHSKEAGLSMLDFNAYAQKLYSIAEELEKDPSFLLFDSYKAYDFHDKVTAIVEKYRVRNAVQCRALFQHREGVSAKDAAHMDTLVKTLLKASAPAILKQLKTNCKDHLPKGKYWNPSEEMKKQMARTPLHNDRMERNFAYLDRAMVRSPNASFFTVSSSAAWVANGTSSWVRGLVAVVRELLVKFAIRQGRSDRAQSKVDVAASAAQKAERKAVDARKAKRSLIRKIRVFHQLCDEEVFTNSKQLVAFIKEQDGNPKAIEKEIRQQLRILVEVYGYNRSQDLFVLSGKTYAGILAAYKKILKPLKKRILEAWKHSPTAALVSSLPLFRNGTSSAKSQGIV